MKMYSTNGMVRRTRKLSIRSQQLISHLYEQGEADSGLDSSGEETSQSSEEINDIRLDPNISMRAYNELDQNIEQLEKDIIQSCDRLVRAVERRKQELLTQVQAIRQDKLHSLQPDNNNESCSRIMKLTSNLSKSDLTTGSCLRFVPEDTLINTIAEYGVIDEGRASAAKSTASGIGLKYAIAEEATQFELVTRNNCGELSWVEQDEVDVLIKKENICYKCIVQNKCNGIYNILYELPESGAYEVHVKVNGHHLEDSPYKCNVFEKYDLYKSLDTTDKPEWTFQLADKSALVEKTDQQRTSKLYTNEPSPAKAWKVRVTAACPKIKMKFGYSNNARLIPDLNEEYYCKFDLDDIISHDLNMVPHHHTYSNYHQSNRRHHRKTRERKQSTFHRSSLTFIIFQDTNEKLIHVAAEGTVHEKMTSFKGDIHQLVPFIGIKHFCKNANCPRPMLVFS